MPPPASHKSEIEPPPQVTTEAIKGFITGAARYGSITLLAHLLLILPHPLPFTTPTPPTSSTSTPRPPPKRPLLTRPLASLSSHLAPLSRVYRPLTPQFKVYLQLSAMIVGGCVWAEKRVGEYLEVVRRGKRVEKRRVEREGGLDG